VPGKQYRQTQASASLIEPDFCHTWYVGFGRGVNLSKWQKLFCKPEWSHCFCFAQVGPFTQVINPTTERLEVGLRDISADAFAEQMIEEGWKIIKITHSPERMKYKSVWSPSCVTVVKTVLGFNTGFFDCNPERLAKSILENSGEMVVC